MWIERLCTVEGQSSISLQWFKNEKIMESITMTRVSGEIHMAQL